MLSLQAIAIKVETCLSSHDVDDRYVKHKAMVLTQTKRDLNAAYEFKKAYDEVAPGRCGVFVGGTDPSVLADFKADRIRTLVVVGRLLEGFDDRHVSVVAIVRNVAPSSRVLFAQFIGRAVRKAHEDDPITTMVISHPNYNQRKNFEQFDRITEIENVDEEDD